MNLGKGRFLSLGLIADVEAVQVKIVVIEQLIKRIVEFQVFWLISKRNIPNILVESLEKRGICINISPHQYFSPVRINLEGREPDGKVAPSNQTAFIDGLERDLKDIVNLESGEPLVAEVVRVSDVCAGAHRDDLPDLPLIRRARLGIAVANAHPFVAHLAHWQTRGRGGHGAVREVTDLLLHARGALQPALERYLS